MRGGVGTVDRWIRITIGVIAVALGAFAGALGLAPAWAYVLYLVGAIGLLTGLAGWCPLYALLGVQTSRKAG